MKPNFFMVGAPKAATTSIYHFLKTFPEVFLPDYKEPNYFCSDFFKSREPKKALERYLHYYSDLDNEKVIGDSSTSYFYSKDAAKNIKEYNPDSKILICLRSPSALIASLYNYYLFLGYEDQSFLQAIELEEKRKLGESLPKNNLFTPRLFYSDILAYYRNATRYTEHFSRENIHFIIFEDLIEDEEKVLNNLLEFLNIENKGDLKLKRENKTYVGRFSGFKGKIDRSLYFRKVRNYLYKKRDKFILANILKKLYLNLFTSSKKSKIVLSEDENNMINRMTKEEVEKLSILLDRDLITLWKM